jgi:hypothetical protein
MSGKKSPPCTLQGKLCFSRCMFNMTRVQILSGCIHNMRFVMEWLTASVV